MARLWTRFGGAALSCGLLLQAAPSLGQKTPPSTTTAASSAAAPAAPSLEPKLDLEGPEAEAKDRARALFQQGVAAYGAGKYYEAVEIFLETQRIYPDTQLCFNIARAYENLGNTGAALRYYRDYLRQADRPSDGPEVRDRVRKLEQQLAQRGVQQLTVLSQPEGATVLLDGKPVGITPWTGETYPGKHRLAVAIDAYAPQERVVEVDAHVSRDVSIVLIPSPKKPTTTPAPRSLPVHDKRPSVSVETLVTLSTGLALLGTAIAAEAASKEPGMSRTTAFLAGGGLGVSTVGGVMLYFDLSPRSKSTQSAPLTGKDSATARP